MNRKKKFTFILAVVLLVSAIPFFAFGAEPVNVAYNGKAVTFPDAKPFIDSNRRTLVPLAPIASAMGLTYTWDAAKKTATFVRDYTAADAPYRSAANESHSQDTFIGRETIAFTIGSKNAVYKAYSFNISDTSKTAPLTDQTYTKQIPMDTASLLRNSRTYAPAKYLAENLGYRIYWNSETQTADIMPIKGAHALLSVELLSGTSRTLPIAVFRGRLYGAAGVSSIHFKNAKIGTDNLHYKNLTQTELDSFSAINSNPLIFGATLEDYFTNGKTVTVTLYFDVSYYTGRTEPLEYEFDYTYSGGPVYY